MKPRKSHILSFFSTNKRSNLFLKAVAPDYPCYLFRAVKLECLQAWPMASESWQLQWCRLLLLPSAIGILCKSRHCMAHILFGDVRLTLLDKVDYPLMCFKVLPPCRCILPGRQDSDTREGKEWKKNFSRHAPQRTYSRMAGTAQDGT